MNWNCCEKTFRTGTKFFAEGDSVELIPANPFLHLYVSVRSLKTIRDLSIQNSYNDQSINISTCHMVAWTLILTLTYVVTPVSVRVFTTKQRTIIISPSRFTPARPSPGVANALIHAAAVLAAGVTVRSTRASNVAILPNPSRPTGA